MSLSLEKGQRVDLSKNNPGLKVAAIGLGWDAGNNFDLDAFAIALVNKKLPGGDHVLYFNSPKQNGMPAILAGGIVHTGDNLTGEGDGDDETIYVDFSKLPDSVTEIIIAANIYQATSRGQNFGMVENAFIRIYNKDTNEELIKYDLSEDFSTNTGVIMGKLYKKDGEWKFQATGEGKNGDINQISENFK